MFADARPFLLALLIGLLIGIERERSTGSDPDKRPLGSRTFALLALLGALAAALPNRAVGAMLALFAVFIWRGLRIGLGSSEPFGTYLALGITVLIATQTIVNLGVVTGLLPTKGLPLPFVSFGGSTGGMTRLSRILTL